MAHGGAGTERSPRRLAVWAYARWVALGMIRPALRNDSAIASIAGLSAPVLYIAWLNRGGPGTVCDADATCTDQYSPWPFVAVAVMLVLASASIGRVVRRSTWRADRTDA